MFWMSKKVREDLQERLQDDYPKAKWILILQTIIPFIFIFLYTLTSYLPFRLFLLRTLPDPNSVTWNPVVWFPSLLMISLPSAWGFLGWIERKRNITERLKGSLYVKYLKWIVLPIFIIVAIGGIWLSTRFADVIFQDYSVPVAIQKWEREVQVPTYLPFKPNQSTGRVDYGFDELSLEYRGQGYILSVRIMPSPLYKVEGKMVTLDDGTKAWLGDSRHQTSDWYGIDFYRDGLWYGVHLEHDGGGLKQEDILKVANSFRPFDSK